MPKQPGALCLHPTLSGVVIDADVGEPRLRAGEAEGEFHPFQQLPADPFPLTVAPDGENGAISEIGGPRGYERGGDRPAREYFAVVCSSCGNQAQVPFRPRMDRPVYCSDCFREVRPD